MKIATEFLKEVDLFSSSFSFLVSGKENKRTIFGGILSLLISSIAAVYFYYLIEMYLSNQFEPRITSRSFISDKKSEITIEKDEIMFEFFINGEPLKQYEKRVGKTYLTYLVTYSKFFQNGGWERITIPMVNSLLENFQGFLTLDNESISIMLDPIELVSTEIEIAINPCNPQIELNCASEQEILDEIFTPINYFQIFTKIQQYNPTSGEYEYQYRSQYMYLDPYLTAFSRFSLMKQKNIIKQGAIIQYEKEYDTVQDYKKIDAFFSAIDLKKRMQIVGYALLVYDMSQSQNVLVVQFPMITEVLAQFSSVLNCFLLLGFIARMISSAHIVEDLNDVLLKGYYKKTAANLLKNSQKKESIQNKLKKCDSIMNLQAQINEETFCKQKKKFFNFGKIERLKIFFYNFLKNQQSESGKISQRQEDDQKQIYKKLNNQSLKNINILELFKELYKLKLAIKLIMSKEQYAALQYCGSEIFIENSPNKQIYVDSNKNNSKQTQENNEVQLKKGNTEQQLQKNLICISPQQFGQSENSMQQCFPDKIECSDCFQGKNKLVSHTPLPLLSHNEKELIKMKNQSPQEKERLLENKKQITDQNDLQIKHFSAKFVDKNIGDTAVDLKESISSMFSQRDQQQSNQLILKEEDQEAIFDESNQHKIRIPFYSSSQQSIQQQKINSQEIPQQTIFRSHLQEMDLIETNLIVSSQYLDKFLNLVKEEEENSNIINSQIFESLLVSQHIQLSPKMKKNT